LVLICGFNALRTKKDRVFNILTLTKDVIIQTKIEELELLNQSLRERDKTKDDSISKLADQILTLTERLKDLERKQQQPQFQYG